MEAKLFITKMTFSTEDRAGGISLCKDISREQLLFPNSLLDTLMSQSKINCI